MSFNLCPNDDRLKCFLLVGGQKTHTVVPQGSRSVCEKRELRSNASLRQGKAAHQITNDERSSMDKLPVKVGIYILMDGQGFYTEYGHQVLLTAVWSICSH